jgi:hypothetical protein
MSWLTDMSANLTADVIVLAGAGLGARTIVNRRASRSLYIAAELVTHGQPDQRVRLTNLGQEPIVNVSVWQVPPLGFTGEAEPLLDVLDLAPGDTVRTRWIDEKWMRATPRPGFVTVQYSTPRNGRVHTAYIHWSLTGHKIVRAPPLPFGRWVSVKWKLRRIRRRLHLPGGR